MKKILLRGMPFTPPYVEQYGALRLYPNYRLAVRNALAHGALKEPHAAVLAHERGVMTHVVSRTDDEAIAGLLKYTSAVGLRGYGYPRGGIALIATFFPSGTRVAATGAQVLFPLVRPYRDGDLKEESLKDTWLGMRRDLPRKLLLPGPKFTDA